MHVSKPASPAAGIRSSRWLCWVVLLAASVAGVGCGRSESPPPSSTTSQAGGAAAPDSADACALLSAPEIAEAVGNSVGPGHQEAGPEVCDWESEQPTEIGLLLMARRKGSLREQVLCQDVRKTASEGKGVSGLGEAARWSFAAVPFNSGELEVCDAKGYISMTLTGKGEEAKLRRAALSLARRALDRL